MSDGWADIRSLGFLLCPTRLVDNYHEDGNLGDHVLRIFASGRVDGMVEAVRFINLEILGYDPCLWVPYLLMTYFSVKKELCVHVP